MKRRNFVITGVAAIVAAGIAFAPPAQAAETLRIATEGAYAPFNNKNAKGELVGFDVDIAKALCAQMKIKCTIVAQDWDGVIPGLMAKKYDAIIASMSITEKRMKKVSFSAPYYSNYLQFVSKTGSGFKSGMAALQGKTIGPQRPTVSPPQPANKYNAVTTPHASHSFLGDMNSHSTSCELGSASDMVAMFVSYQHRVDIIKRHAD